MYDYCMNDLTPVFQERNRKKHELIDQGLEEEDYYEAMASFKPVFVFISDLVLFMKEVYADTRNMKGFMETLFRKGEDHKISFIAALPLENRAEAAGYEAFSLFTQYRTGDSHGREPLTGSVSVLRHSRIQGAVKGGTSRYRRGSGDGDGGPGAQTGRSVRAEG